jgi:hypothetical protein
MASNPAPHEGDLAGLFAQVARIGDILEELRGADLTPADAGGLSAAEAVLLETAVRDESARQQRESAFHVMVEAILDYDMGWYNMIEQPTAGEVAAKLYSTWEPQHRDEPFVESRYAVTGIYADLEAALSAHGLPTYDERCAELGRRLVDSAREYIFACHDNDAEDAERTASERRQAYLRQLQQRLERE